MILLADSGGSKTRWYLLKKAGVSSFTGIGLNPNVVAQRSITQALKKVRRHTQRYEIHEIFFYGAGTGKALRKKIIVDALKRTFPSAKVNVHTDLEGAARGLLGSNSGIAGIIGTGSNAGAYNGKHITKTSAGKGFPEGDHGSGSWLGLRLLQDDVTGKMPDKLKIAFRPYQYVLRRSLRKGTRPAAAVAALSVFAFKKRNSDYMKDQIAACAYQYWEHYLRPLKVNSNTKLVLTGGLAWTFRKEFASVLRKKRIKASFQPDPGKGLVVYHRQLSRSRK